MTFDRIRQYFNETIWMVEFDTLSLVQRAWYRTARVGYIVFKGFTDKGLNQQAAALTYVSFLAIIPFIAVVVSLAKGFGFQKLIESKVKEALYVIDPEYLDTIIRYVSDTKLTALGAVGFMVLIWTVMKALLNLERSFNQIWSVNRNRPLHRAVAYYLSVLLVVPFLVAASTTAMTILQTENPDSALMRWVLSVPGAATVLQMFVGLLPLLITWLAFALVYAFLVNTHVNFRATVSGAFVASLLWNMLQWLYMEAQTGLSRNAIYGTFAFLPVFLVYLYGCWLITLFGCRITYALQNERYVQRERMASASGLRYKIATGFMILQEVALAFDQGKKPLKATRIANRLDLPLPLVKEILKRMIDADLLLETVSTDGKHLNIKRPIPARNLEKIQVIEVFHALEGGDPESDLHPQIPPSEGPLLGVIMKAQCARDAALEGITVKDLIRK